MRKVVKLQQRFHGGRGVFISVKILMTTVEKRIFQADACFDAAYRLLSSSFADDALANRESFEADFRTTALDGLSPFVMLARFATPTSVSGVICGAYLPLSEHVSIGFIEYLV